MGRIFGGKIQIWKYLDNFLHQNHRGNPLYHHIWMKNQCSSNHRKWNQFWHNLHLEIYKHTQSYTNFRKSFPNLVGQALLSFLKENKILSSERVFQNIRWIWFWWHFLYIYHIKVRLVLSFKKCKFEIQILFYKYFFQFCYDFSSLFSNVFISMGLQIWQIE